MTEQLRRLRLLARVVQAVSLVIGLLLAAGGIVYLTVTASDLPSWWPGQTPITTSAHHVARGWVLLALAVIALAVLGVATWALSSARSGDPADSAGRSDLTPATGSGPSSTRRAPAASTPASSAPASAAPATSPDTGSETATTSEADPEPTDAGTETDTEVDTGHTVA